MSFALGVLWLAPTAQATPEAHPAHAATPIRSALACADCHACPGPTPIFGGLAAAEGAVPVYDPATRTCSGVYCHGATLRAPPAQDPSWVGGDLDYSDRSVACARCHGFPPPPPHPRMTACRGCHRDAVRADGSIDTDGGHHVDGVLDYSGPDPSAGCAGCHGYPPADGAHAAHFGLAGVATNGQYGESTVLEDRYPTASPTTAPAVYAFGCGNCHPLDSAKHLDGQVDVELWNAATPAGSPKALASPSAAYDPATRTCQGVYCHSSGQSEPTFVASPSWASPQRLGCDGCHSNPPRYESGGAGASNANSHLVLGDDGWEVGHFLGMPGPWHSSQHGGAWGPGIDASPITCQTCHYETTDPWNTGTSGFYYLDTSGSYSLPGGDPSRIRVECTDCHGPSSGAARLGTGKVLPLRHVNGRREVTFDPRTSLPEDIAWLPAPPNRPTRPIWFTRAMISMTPPGAVRDGSTFSASLAGASYDPGSKTCSNVACHLAQTQVTWGVSPVGWATCDACHGYY